MTDIADMTDKKVYTVADICGDIKKYVGGNAKYANILVEGEVLNLSDPSRKHIYFTLKDKIKEAILPVAMFGWREKLGNTLPIKDKESVYVYGSINIYEARGQYQLIAENIISHGVGDLEKKLEALKEKLRAAGFFDKAHKRSLPKYASRIGIVTSESGAIIGDIIDRANDINPFVQLILYPSLVQGAGAAQNMAKGIREMQYHAVDVIIVGRGGGPDQDFSSFNEEELARAIYESKVPVITSIGHNINNTISDLVADKYTTTPTEAPDLVVFDVWNVLQTMDRMRKDLNRLMNDRKKLAKKDIENYSLKLETKTPDKILSKKRGKVNELASQLKDKHPATLVQRKRTDIIGYERDLKINHPASKISEYRMRVKETGTQLSIRMDQIIKELKTNVWHYSEKLEERSPFKKMESGYAFLIRDDGQRISCVDGLTPGTRIRAYMRDGSFTAVVDEVETDNAAED